MASELDTAQLRLLVDRLQGGDQSALDELLRLVSQRLEHLARSMLRRFPTVREHEQTGDIVQEASMSLISALRQLSFSSTREFYGLAAEHMRRRLLGPERPSVAHEHGPERPSVAHGAPGEVAGRLGR